MNTHAPGVIRSDEAYTVLEFRKRTGLGDYTWREVRRKLKIVKIGRKRFVLGSDWFRYLESQLAVEHAIKKAAVQQRINRRRA